MNSKAQFPCPSCGFIVFGEGPGSYAICSICNWEDDDVQLRNPTSGMGANHESLVRSQEKILKRYPVKIKEAKSFSRDPSWRPLEAKDLRTVDKLDFPEDYFEATKRELDNQYYWFKD